MWYEVELTPDDDTLLVTSPHFPSSTASASVETPLVHAKDALEEVLAARIDYNEAVPTRPSGRSKGAISSGCRC